MLPEAATQTLSLCARIASLTDVPSTITRPFLSPATAQVHTLLREEMHSLGMSVRTDSIGNLRGTLPGTNPHHTLLLGSHIDTVPNAGPYDGILGVALPLALLHTLKAPFRFNIELIAFSEEEGIRFKLPFIGSRALTGTLMQQDLARQDPAGTTIQQACTNFGLPPYDPQDCALTPGTFAFLECHIEQGPVLESLGLPLGIVSTIAGQSRFLITFTGQANHAGTTPMHLRKDALAAAAQFITTVETLARGRDSLVATVGIIHAQPGAANIIPGTATLTLDVRHPQDFSRAAAVHLLTQAAQTIATNRGLTVEITPTSEQSSVPMHPSLREALKNAAPPGTPEIPSGAGHDAMILAPQIPSAMLFLRTPAGLSHHPEESVSASDIEAALETLHNFLHHMNPQVFVIP